MEGLCNKRRVKKRTFEEGREVKRTYASINEIPKRDGNTLTYDEFFREYMNKNLPVIITSLTNNWNARKDWVIEHNNKKDINFEFLLKHFGDSVVTVHSDVHKQTNQKCELMKFSEYIEYWKKRYHNKQIQETDALQLTHSDDLRYLKVNNYHCIVTHPAQDWHLTREYKDYKPYETPIFFSDDWMNAWYDNVNKKDDYRFVYMGCKGTWTPLHADVLRSYSWSSNIRGRKLWIFFAPDQLEYLQDKLGNTVYDINNVDHKVFTRFKEAKRIECIQEEGETIFVPSCWYHTVYNLEDTISINHNWGNACNLDLTWKFLKDDFENIKKAIDDIRELLSVAEWHRKCLQLLEVNSGMDFAQFFSYVQYNCNLLMKLLESSDEDEVQTALFNFRRAHAVLQQMLQEDSVKFLIEKGEIDPTFVTKLHQILSNYEAHIVND